MTSVGGRVRTLRTEQGLNLPALAAKSGLSKGLLSKLENDSESNPSLDTLHKLAQAFDVTIADLLGEQVTVSIREVPRELPEWTKHLVKWLKETGETPDKDILEAMYVLQNRKGSARTPDDWKFLYRNIAANFPQKS